jgi:hypothetical protein
MTTTVEGQLSELRRRVGRLSALARTGAAGDPARIERHVDALRRHETRLLAADGDEADQFEEKLWQMKTRLTVAECSLAADASDDWTSFAAAVEDELRGWDTYLERLQATAARRTELRDPAEAAIGDVRSRRIAVDARLARAHAVARETWQEQRARVGAARDELERRADELSMTLLRGAR